MQTKIKKEGKRCTKRRKKNQGIVDRKGEAIFCSCFPVVKRSNAIQHLAASWKTSHQHSLIEFASPIQSATELGTVDFRRSNLV